MELPQLPDRAYTMGLPESLDLSITMGLSEPSDRTCSLSRWRPQKVDKRMVLEHTHGLFIT